MRKALWIACCALLLAACQDKETTQKSVPAEKCSDKKTQGKQFEMYTMSEMAALMEQMYGENDKVKQKIQQGKPLGDFPEYYLKIHTAKFTDPAENDAVFKQKAMAYIVAQQKLYADKDPAHAKGNFNKGVDACIACHENKCGGPIPRIKKLYLK